MQLLPTGKVMFWDSYEKADYPHLWDPVTSTITPAAQAGYNIFCTGFSFLPDGRLFVAGGHISDNVGLSFASVYNPFTNTWARLPDMNAGRWYPIAATLANGDVLVASGMVDTVTGMNLLPQVWQAATGSWHSLSNAQLQMPYYPYMFLAPNGMVFYAGPGQAARYLDTSGSGAWSIIGNNNYGSRNWGSAVMYEPGKALIVGGIRGDFYNSESAVAPTATAEVIDLNAASPSWRYVAAMAYPRKHHNATILPDGKVLVTGGSSGSEHTNSDSTNPAYTAEVWDPETESWATLAGNTTYRGYHATALLLPDGRVLSAGGDHGGAGAEIYSPPYLFKGTRPTITSVPASVSYGQTFTVGTPDAASITKVTWLRLSTVTHTNNMSQQINRLSFSQVADGLTVTTPGSANQCPPGYYMLFILNGNGVPSMAKIIRIEGAALIKAPSAPTNLAATAVSNGQINLTWRDNSNNEDGFKIERCQGSTCKNFAQVATVGANVTNLSNAGLSSSTTYRYRVHAFNSAGNSGYSNTVAATTMALSPPAAPSNLTAAAVSSSQINLAWTDHSSDESGFKIERCQGAGCTNFTQVATVGTNATSYSDANLTASTTYQYRVHAYNGDGNSTYSNTANATTQSDGSAGGSLLTDDFNDNSRSANWVVGMIAAANNYDSSVSVAEVNQQLEITPRTNWGANAYNGYITASSYDFTGLQAKVKLVQAPSGTHAEAVLTVGIDGSNRYIIGVRGDQVYFTNVLNGSWTETSQTYDATLHKYIRIRHNPTDDTINYETSSDALTWTSRRSIPRNFAITSINIDLVAGSNGPATSPGMAIFDDFRLESQSSMAGNVNKRIDLTDKAETHMNRAPANQIRRLATDHRNGGKS